MDFSIIGSQYTKNEMWKPAYGLFNQKDSEVEKGGHAGWKLKITGTGGRASRVRYETLVCLTNSADA